MSVLDTKSNRVTLKMDVSHTEHSHVIGKGGNNIKKVMEETGCHIHFPDSNRNNQAEKSNQVSIAGQPGGVEAARAKIRELLPLVLSFELPAIVQPDPGSPTVQHISQTYNLTISFKPPTRLYGASGVVRGSQNNTTAVKRGTALLLEHLAGSLASAMSVSTHLDIAPQHHLFMMGRNGGNIKHIIQRTGAQIHFPDPNSPQKKSTVYIQGTIESVCLARQYLMGCLPLVLMFDIKEDIEVEPQCITALMEQLDVFISIKPKPKQPSKSVIVKSVERNAVSMYEARKFLLGLESSGVSSCSTSMAVSPSMSSSPSSNGNSIICPVGLEILTSAGLGLSTLGLLGAAVSHSMNSSPASNSVLNGLNSSMSPLQTAGSATPSASLWPSSLTGTQDKQSNGVPDCAKGSCSLNGHVKEASGHNPSEPLSSKSNQDEGSDTFVEVGMPRSPSHSANGNELKQMLASCKTSSGKRQAVELLHGTKNSHLHSDCLLSDTESSSSDSPMTDKRAPGSERAAERAAQQSERERIRLDPAATYANMQ
ncbi:hypothetical protein NHX12_022445, partial [Muraenolepis orangiensis]